MIAEWQEWWWIQWYIDLRWWNDNNIVIPFILMSFHSFWCHSTHSNLISSFQCHSIHSDVIPLIPMSFYSFRCHSTHSDVILTSFHHSDVILLILTSFHHSDVIPFIPMSLQSFYIGMIERGENERDFWIKVRALDFFPGVLSTNERPLFWALDQ